MCSKSVRNSSLSSSTTIVVVAAAVSLLAADVGGETDVAVAPLTGGAANVVDAGMEGSFLIS